MEEAPTALTTAPPIGAVLPVPTDPPRFLTSREENFAVYLSGGMKFEKAARSAGLEVKDATDLISEPVFAARIKSLQGAYDRYIGITKETHADKLAEIRERAMMYAATNEKQQGALMGVALKAEQLRGEVAGLYAIDTAGRVLGGGTAGRTGVTFNVNFVKSNVEETAPRVVEGVVL